MPQHLPVFVAIAVTVLTVDHASAQSNPAGRTADPIAILAATHGGRIHGVVRDDVGRGVSGVSVLAMGRTLALARSDQQGHFALSVPAGDYILRATREGYVSTYREAVRVQTAAQLERNITLLRQGVRTIERSVLTAGLAGSLPAVADQLAQAAATDHSHSEAAWRLRHLPRSVLRDGPAPVVDPSNGGFRPKNTLLDKALYGSARAATSFFADTDFYGQVNFLTTSAVAGTHGWLPAQWPRGIASMAVGAPVGRHGDWSVRGAVTAGDLASWVLLGEYEARESLAHAFRLGMSFSAQGHTDRQGAALGVPATDIRNVGGIYGFDLWRIRPGITLDYGVRFDRYDYVASRFISPRVGARVTMFKNTHLITMASRRTVAPGADEFLPPASAGLWLPPERTFSSLVPRRPLKAEQVHHFEIGVEQQFGPAGASRTISVRRFRHAVLNQVATLFGVDETSDIGHYYVASPGNVDFDAWGVRLSARMLRRVAASIDYSTGVGAWHHRREARLLRYLAPTVVRSERERVHDLTASVDAAIPETATRVSAVYRLNSAFSSDEPGLRTPSTAGRFDVQVHQGLPFQPIKGGRLEVVFAIQSLFRDFRDPGSLYDELLTLAPPMRLMSGVQVRF
ncbi:MAG TPA: TonB-dependent receptor [Vicinamibacterales bacterium]|nr:TonB-dependent receptor [Vicinamibacterales bacterium]